MWSRVPDTFAAKTTGLVLVAALLPVPMTMIEIVLGQALYGQLTSGLVPGDPAFNEAYVSVGRVIMVSHWIVTPVLSLALLMAGAAPPWRRAGPGAGLVSLMFCLIPLAVVFFALQCGGFLVLIPRFFTA
jgi:hypothetical protein